MNAAIQEKPLTNGHVDTIIDCHVHELHYGPFKAVRDTHIPIRKGTITAFIGPSGCGKSTVLRCLNRMNDLVRGFRFTGHVHFGGKDIYAHNIDPVAVRRHIGMVFQQPNPFSMSIFNNVAFGLRLNGYKGNVAERVEKALRSSALWDEVKDKLRNNGLSLSGGQQQRLCIARAIATEPSVLLMDEPCSRAGSDRDEAHRGAHAAAPVALHHRDRDAQSAAGQARRRHDGVHVRRHDPGGRTGYLVEYAPTAQIFDCPTAPETQQYIRGEFS